MAVKLIIDGYNLMGASAVSGLAGREGLEAARERLLEQLLLYKRAKGFHITVVFDGQKLPLTAGSFETYKGIVVAYSKAPKIADDLIVEMVAKSPLGVTVVSSDRQVAKLCRGLGASVISSEQFRARMVALITGQAKGTSRGQDDEERPIKLGTRKKGPSSRASKRRRKDRRVLDKL